MKVVNRDRVRFTCDFCGWEGLDVVSQPPYVSCPECGYPICSIRHNMDYLVPQAQARYRHMPYDESIGKNVRITQMGAQF